jgi:predicted nucleic acid-binding protein
MDFVLDASVTASWHFEDERTEEADRLLDSVADDRLLVPAHWWFEIRNVLLLGERRGRTRQPETEEFLNRLAPLPIETASNPKDPDVFALARRHRLTFYDAAYLELALREKVALATLDKDLADAAAAEGVSLVIER